MTLNKNEKSPHGDAVPQMRTHVGQSSVPCHTMKNVRNPYGISKCLYDPYTKLDDYC